jgi:hypothetical protein
VIQQSKNYSHLRFSSPWLVPFGSLPTITSGYKPNSAELFTNSGIIVI